MSVMTLERAEQREQTPRAIDLNGRHLFRGQIDQRSVVRREASDGGDEAIGFAGHAIVWNKRTWIGSKRWGFWEQIAPEAVTKTLQEADIRFLQNHDANLLLARNTAGTLRLTSDATGLAVDADMAPTSYARDLALLLARGDISQMSFAFEDVAWTYEEAEDGNPLYTLTEIRLFDVAVVTYPAYAETDAGLRSLAFEQLCRTAGLSAAASRQFTRQLAMGEDVDPEIVESIRAAVPTLSTPPAPQAPAERSDSAPAETTHTPDPPAETTGANHRSDDPDPGDRLRDLAFNERARAMKGTR